MAYPTLADVKTYLGLTTTDDDARLTLIISWTEALIHAYLGRNLNEATYTHKSYKPVSDNIQLDNYPVSSITSITIDGETKTLADYDLVEDVGIVYGDFTTGDFVTIIYVGGYATLPTPIEDCFYAIIEDRYKEYKGISGAEVRDVTLFDFAKVSYDTSTTNSGSRSLTYTGVNSTGHVPQVLQNYLGILDMYKSNKSLLSVEGIG